MTYESIKWFMLNKVHDYFLFNASNVHSVDALLLKMEKDNSYYFLFILLKTPSFKNDEYKVRDECYYKVECNIVTI